MTTFIVGGGQVDIDFLKSQINACKEKTIIACDKGYVHLEAAGVVPDYAIGDFDSAGSSVYEEILKQGIECIKLNPIKDDTDSEAALKLAMEKGPVGDIIFLGATGSRIDHLLGNIALLGLAAKANRRLILLDRHNKIYMLSPFESITIKKAAQFGSFISIYPYMGRIEGVKLEGFKYTVNPLNIEGFNTLTESNEIVDSAASITNGDGYLIVLETLD